MVWSPSLREPARADAHTLNEVIGASFGASWIVAERFESLMKAGLGDEDDSVMIRQAGVMK